jgi:hypothetical protein
VPCCLLHPLQALEDHILKKQIELIERQEELAMDEQMYRLHQEHLEEMQKRKRERQQQLQDEWKAGHTQVITPYTHTAT